MTHVEKLLAARDLLVSTRRTLQLVDEEIAKVKEGRVAVETARDVSSEHRVAWFGVTDDNDHKNGIKIDIKTVNPVDTVPRFFNAPFRGTVRVQEDAAFVCTQIMVARRRSNPFDLLDPDGPFTEVPQNTNVTADANLLVRLVDGNTGRNLTPGISTGPYDRDRGVIPLSFLSSIRFGLGSNFKNKLFSEFTIPRAGTVRVEIYNMTVDGTLEEDTSERLYLSLFGYKVFGA